MTAREAPVRAGVVVTGTEVLTGRVRDANGPWLAERLLELGVELAHVVICGDRPEDMEAQLRFLAGEGVDVVLTSGGLGPTADDLTLEVVARFAERPLVLDTALEQRIAAIVAPMRERWTGLDEEAIDVATRKQAFVPDGATVLEPVGTAPGMVVPPRTEGPLVVVLPGPPGELQGMWPAAVASEPIRALLGAAADFEESTLRLFGIPESEIAETLRVAAGEVDGLDRLEVTTCLRRGEVEVVVRHDPGDSAWEGLREVIAARHADTLFSSDGTTVDEQVAALLDGRLVATAESCTGGLVAARLTDRAGSSAFVAGGAVTYSDEAKSSILGVDPQLIEEFGAVSVEVAEALAAGALSAFDCFAAVSTTGVAGPDGGTEAKPVGTVCFGVALASGERETLRVHLPGSRADVRDRSTTVALHLLRRVLLAAV